MAMGEEHKVSNARRRKNHARVPHTSGPAPNEPALSPFTLAMRSSAAVVVSKAMAESETAAVRARKELRINMIDWVMLD